MGTNFDLLAEPFKRLLNINMSVYSCWSCAGIGYPFKAEVLIGGFGLLIQFCLAQMN